MFSDKELFEDQGAYLVWISIYKQKNINRRHATDFLSHFIFKNCIKVSWLSQSLSRTREQPQMAKYVKTYCQECKPPSDKQLGL